jgi:hypothetical protein
VRAFAEHQPVTSIVNAIRDLSTQQPVGADVWIALPWCAGILIVACVLAMVSYRPGSPRSSASLYRAIASIISTMSLRVLPNRQRVPSQPVG